MGKFGWYVSSDYAAYTYLAGLSLDEAYTDMFACAHAFRVGRKKTKEVFGSEILDSTPYCPPISYGHIGCLGVPLMFPKDSEPAVQPFFPNLREGIAFLKRKVNFKQSQLFQIYWTIHCHLKDQFPKETFGFGGFGWEGPVTTAVLLRGQDFYMDLYDDPEDAKIFLSLVTQSCIEFVQFLRTVNHQPLLDRDSTSMSEDFASLIAPDLWPEFVVPYMNRYYSALTDGKRCIHIENLKPEHLKYLKEVGIRHFDPSISPRLTPGIIKKELDVIYGWRLASFDLDRMNRQEVQSWISHNRQDGADVVYTILEKSSCLNENPRKIMTFIETCKEVESKSN